MALRTTHFRTAAPLEVEDSYATIQGFRVGVLPFGANPNNFLVSSERSTMPDIRITIRLGR
jgi:hypothetical protein